ncbi:MAG: hypothetical protein LBD88_04390 [Candidatus Peribacteria bacterium]|nr:hypothetical protein [Candidatus Peribacteria bacterium]
MFKSVTQSISSIVVKELSKITKLHSIVTFKVFKMEFLFVSRDFLDSSEFFKKFSKFIFAFSKLFSAKSKLVSPEVVVFHF